VSWLTLTHQALNLTEAAHAHSRPAKIWASCSRSLRLTLFFEFFGTLVDAVFDERDVVSAAVQRFLPNKRECNYYSLNLKYSNF